MLKNTNLTKGQIYQIDEFIKHSRRIKKEYGSISEIEIRLSQVGKDYRLDWLNHALMRYEEISGRDLCELEKLSKVDKKLKKELGDFWARSNKLVWLYNELENPSVPGELKIVHLYERPDPTKSLFSDLVIPHDSYNDFYDYFDELIDANIISFENNERYGGKIIVTDSRSPKKEIYKIYDDLKSRFNFNVKNHWEIFSKWFVYYKNGNLEHISPERLRKDYSAYREIIANNSL